MNNGNRRKMYQHIPLKRRLEIIEMISNMPLSLEKEALSLMFIEDMSPPEAAEYAKKRGLCIGKQFKTVCARRFEQIAKKYIPDLGDYTPKHTSRYERRKVHIDELKQFTKDRCARCGSTKRLEMDHIIPLCVGGTSDDINLQTLCYDCHVKKTAYERTIFPNAFKPCRKRPKEQDNGQITFVEVDTDV